MGSMDRQNVDITIRLVAPFVDILRQQTDQFIGFSQIDIVQGNADLQIANLLDAIVAFDCGRDHTGKFNNIGNHHHWRRCKFCTGVAQRCEIGIRQRDFFRLRQYQRNFFIAAGCGQRRSYRFRIQLHLCAIGQVIGCGQTRHGVRRGRVLHGWYCAVIAKRKRTAQLHSFRGLHQCACRAIRPAACLKIFDPGSQYLSCLVEQRVEIGIAGSRLR